MTVDRFIFFAVCKDTGICTKHTLSELYLKYAEKQMFKAMAELLDAQISGKFSTGWPDENVIHLPSYLEDEVMEETLLAKAMDVNGLEIGRAKQPLNLDQDEAKLFTFTFDTSVEMDSVTKFVIDLQKK